MASTRFPGKPLADILGLPMIEHVRRRLLLSHDINDVIVATCDQEILDLVQSYGGQVIMTSDQHERCTDRVAEAIAEINADVVINVQGDEPLINPEMIGPLLEPLKKEKDLLCTNLMNKIETNVEFNNPNVVKMVSNSLPKLKCGDLMNKEMEMKKLKDGNEDRENLYSSLDPKTDAKYMFLVSIKDIKAGEEITANYNLYTYPKTGIGIQGL